MENISKATAKAIIEAFDLFHTRFKEYARKSKSLFESRDWQAIQHDSAERLNLYKRIVDKLVNDIKESLAESVHERPLWRKIKERFSKLVAGHEDLEIAETFFNS